MNSGTTSILRTLAAVVLGLATMLGACGPCWRPDAALAETAADQAALEAAAAALPAGRVLTIDRPYRLTRSLTLSVPVQVTGGGQLVSTAPDVTVTLAGPVMAADEQVLFAGPGRLALPAARRISVAWWGAVPGVPDAAPALRAAFASGDDRTIVIPPGDYRLASTVPSSYPAIDPAAVLVRGRKGLDVSAKGARLVVAPAIALSEAVLLDRDDDITWTGGTVVGNRSGLGVAAENAGFGVMNVRRFTIRDVSFETFGGNGAGIVGNWMVDGLFQDLQMHGVGICLDVAYVHDVTVDRLHATGADAAGQAGPGHVGMKCLSNVHDTNVGADRNATGLPLDDTDGLTLTRSDIANFDTGVALASGRRITIVGNTIHDNPGHGSTKGLGVYIYTITDGAAGYRSVDFPVRDVCVADNSFVRNGAKSGGYGVLIAAGAKAGPIAIVGNRFQLNASGTVASADTVSRSAFRLGRNRLDNGSPPQGLSVAAATAQCGLQEP